MFSKQFKAAFYVLAQAFMTLYKMPADWEPSDEHEEIPGDEYLARIAQRTRAEQASIAQADRPDTGSGPDAPAATNTAAEAFNSGADVAAVFQQPVYQMTEKANTWTREQMIAGGWTDAGLLAEGFMVDVTPKPAPSTAVAPPPPPAPVVPQVTSAPPAPAAPPPAPSAANAGQAAVPQSGNPVETDSEGYPWDGRIHSGGRTKTAKGAWVRRKNVQDGLVKQVQAELRQRPAPVTTTPFVPLQEAPAPVAPPAAVAPPPPALVPPAPVTAGAASAVADALARANAGAPLPTPTAPGAVDIYSYPQSTNFSELMTFASRFNLSLHFKSLATSLGMDSIGPLAGVRDPAKFHEAHAILLGLAA